MRFKQWLGEAAPQQWLNAPSKWKMLGAAGKAAADFVPVLGSAVNVVDNVKNIMGLIRQNQDVTKQVMQMMHQQDQNGGPANALDLNDDMAQMLSDPTKQEIAQKIIAQLRNLNNQNLDPKFADKIAVQHVRNIMNQTGVA